MIVVQSVALTAFGFCLFATLCALIDQSEGAGIMAASAAALAALHLILELFK